MKKKRKKDKPHRLAQWWQQLRNGMREARKRARERYKEWHQRQIYYELPPEELSSPRKAERITMLTAIRILLAELGEAEYWRTIWHLIWRPGYVIRDYLNGRRRQYLHPFQLLIATTLLLGLVAYIVPAKIVPTRSFAEELESVIQQETDAQRLSPEGIVFCQEFTPYLDAYRQWYDEHPVFGLLVGSVMVVFFTWLLFRKSPRKEYPDYNLAEILTAQIFIIAQLQTVSIVWILTTGWFVPTITFHPYAFPNVIASIIVFMDYQQLFGRKWYSTLWRTLFCVIW